MKLNAEEIKRELEGLVPLITCPDYIKKALALIYEQEQRIEELTKIAEFYRREEEKNAECRIKSAE